MPNFSRISCRVLRSRPLWAKGPKYRELSSLRKRTKPEARQRRRQVHADMQEALVVGEVGVVLGFPLLDQLAFEKNGLAFRPHLQHVKVRDQVEHGGDLRLLNPEPAGWLKVRGNPALQVLRLTDIQNAAETVFHEVHARAFRQMADLFFQFTSFRDWHTRPKDIYSHHHNHAQQTKDDKQAEAALPVAP
jgi:hypothetical protein